MNADDINANLEEAEQSVLRKMAKASVRAGGPSHFFSDSDRFDQIAGGMVVRRNNASPTIIYPETPEPFPGVDGGELVRASAERLARIRGKA